MTKDYKQIQKEAFSSEFVKYCKKYITKDLKELEKTRKTILTAIKVTYVIAAIILIIGQIFSIKYKGIIDIPSIAVSIMISGTINSILAKSYATEAKKMVLAKLISYAGNFQIKDSMEISSSLRNYVEDLNLFSYFNRFHCEDCFSGEYKNIKLNIAELRLRKVSQSSKKKTSVTIFEGLFLYFDFHKKFNGITTVKRDTLKLFNNSNRVNLEDPEFEKLYDVESTDQIEARYLLTPAFMNRMVELSKSKVGEEGILVSFKDGKINIAVSSSKNWFEIPITQPATEIANYRMIILELVSILSIIDTLKLDENSEM